MIHLRRIMLEELRRLNYAESTIAAYIRTIEHFSRHCRRPPDQLGPEHVLRYRAALFTHWKLTPNTGPWLEGCRELAKLKVVIGAQLRQALVDAELKWCDAGPLLRVRGRGRFDVTIAGGFVTPGGQVRWAVRVRSDCPKHRLIIVRLEPGKTCVRDFVLMSKLPRVLLYFTLTDS